MKLHVLALVLFVAACAKGTAPASPPPTTDEKTCGSGAHALHCPRGTFCGHAPAPPSPPASDDGAAGEEAPPRGPSSVGGSCGGIAGFHCADGLECEMPPGQELVADGMGTCVLPWKCVPGSF